MAHYACSDFHGRYDLAVQAIDHLRDGDHLYYLGDAIDRGPRSFETLRLLITHPQVTFFIGNHEDMMLKSTFGDLDEKVYIDEHTYSRQEAREIWFSNGGKSTFNELINFMNEHPSEFDTIWSLLEDGILEQVTQDDAGHTIILTHAGFYPGRRKPTASQRLWDRDHIELPWPEGFDDIILVHGHTPIQYIREYQDEFDSSPYWYCDNHKVCIDLMSAYSGFATMVNIDTWEHITLEGDHEYDL